MCGVIVGLHLHIACGGVGLQNGGLQPAPGEVELAVRRWP